MDEFDQYEMLYREILNAKTLEDINMDQESMFVYLKKTIENLFQSKYQITSLQLQIQHLNESKKKLKEKYKQLKIEYSELYKFNQEKRRKEQRKCFEMKKIDLNRIQDQKVFIEKKKMCLRNKKNQFKKKQEIKINKNIEIQKVRNFFNHILIEQLNQTNNYLSNLYSSLTGNNDIQIRPMVLTIIFAIRWKNIKKDDIQLDKFSLLGLASNNCSTFNSKIDGIQNVFKSLTNELMEAKKKIKENISDEQKVSQNSQKFENELNLNNELEKKIDVYKSKISDLNEQIASMIPPQKFDEVMSNFSSMVLENDDLKKSILKLQNEISILNAKIIKYKEKYKNSNIKCELIMTENTKIKNQFDSQNNDINLLNTRLENRTKDLLSLERMTCKIRPMFFKNQDNFTSPDDICPEFTKENINPKFLLKETEEK